MKQLNIAINHLSKNDNTLSTIIKKFGKCNIQKDTNYLKAIISYIIGQQLSLTAASKINHRFFNKFGQKPNLEEILNTDIQVFKDIGLSQSKIVYIKDLCVKIKNKIVSLKGISKKTDEEIISELTKIKGIGIWTAHMFLIFTLGRLNVLASKDLGIKKGIKLLYNLNALPTEREVEELAAKNNWNPYNTVACIYIWKYLDKATK